MAKDSEEYERLEKLTRQWPQVPKEESDELEQGRLTRCAECGHKHPAQLVDDLHGDGSEMMCVWCVRADYGNDPLGDPRKAPSDSEETGHWSA